MLSLLLVYATNVLAPLPFCDKGAPQPVGFHSRGFAYVAEIFPPKSRKNQTDKPVAFLYEVAPPGNQWLVKARLLWTTPLANQPQAALVSMAGDVVTLDDYYQSGFAHALVIYAQDGRLVRSFNLDELLSPSTLAAIELSDCGRLWRQRARFFFVNVDERRLYVLLGQDVIELRLSDGALRRGKLDQFPTLSNVITRSHPNEETEVWQLNLRFASLTDSTR